MPLNYASVDQCAQRYAEQAMDYLAKSRKNAAALSELFEEAAADSDHLRQVVEFASQDQSNLPLAKPLQENVLQSFPASALPASYTILAADGSQIVPSRHRALQFGLVNIGLLTVRFGSGEAPEIKLISEMLDYDEILAADGSLLGEDDISLIRDLKERTFIRKEIHSELPRPLLTLTDGPLDLFYRSDIKGSASRKAQQEVFEIDQAMEAEGVLSAGYIDKPGSALLHKMLDAWCQGMGLLKPELHSKKAQVSDRILLAHRVKPGERSALFEIVSKDQGQNRLKVAFFYLNVSTSPDYPWLARVEIPLWIAQQADLVNFIHAAIFKEAQVLDSHPYPYCLHRAHELAIVKQAEVEEVENMLLNHIPAESGIIAVRSNKDFHKGLK